MLNDIKRENRVRDRLEELKMLSLSSEEMCVCGSVDNKEGLLPWTWSIFGGGKGTVDGKKKNGERSETEKEKVKSLPRTKHIRPFEPYMELHDLEKDYILIHLWGEYFSGNLGNPDQRKCCELRYYNGETALRYFIDKTEHPITECKKQYYDTAWKRYDDMQKVYQVIQQQQEGEVLTEIRIYKDETEELWRYEHGQWLNITTQEDYVNF
jgi:hypothetical protein